MSSEDNTRGSLSTLVEVPGWRFGEVVQGNPGVCWVVRLLKTKKSK